MQEITFDAEGLDIPAGVIAKQEGKEDIDYRATISNLISSHVDTSGIEIPEKLRVMVGEGEAAKLNFKDSVAKVIGSYTDLEKRMGSGEAPPKDVAGYKVDMSGFPETHKPDEARVKTFLETLHGSKLNNKQVQTVFNAYAGLVKEGLEMQQQSKAQGLETLKAAWGENFETKKGKAIQAFVALADNEDKEAVSKEANELGNNATFLKIMSTIAEEHLNEDVFIDGSSVSEEGIQELMKSEAYLKKDHLDHKAVVEKVFKLNQILTAQQK